MYVNLGVDKVKLLVNHNVLSIINVHKERTVNSVCIKVMCVLQHNSYCTLCYFYEFTYLINAAIVT